MAAIQNTLTMMRNGTAIGTVATPVSYKVFTATELTLTEGILLSTQKDLYFTGDPITFTLTIVNTSSESITDVTIADTVNAAVTISKYTLNGGAELDASNNFSLLLNSIPTTGAIINLIGTIA